MLGVVNSFTKNGIVTTDYDPSNTSTYKVVNPIYEEFMLSVQEEEDDIAATIIRENTIYDPDTMEIISQPEVITELNYINHGYAFAYINMTDKKVKFGSKYKFSQKRKQKIWNFYESINTIKTKDLGDNKYKVYNEFLTIEAVADKYFPNDEADRSMFMDSYNLYCEFFGVYTSGTATEDNNFKPGTGGGTDTEESEDSDSSNSGEQVSGGMDIPLYLQYSGSWADKPYGTSTITKCGCAPTCLAMVMSYLRGKTILPSDIVDFTGNKYYVNGVGSSWDIFPAVAIHYQVSCSNLGMSESEVIDALKNGRPVIASMGPGTFTKGGHFIVLRGVTAEGKVLVNDPNDNGVKDHKNKSFDMSLIMSEAKNFWSFY